MFAVLGYASTIRRALPVMNEIKEIFQSMTVRVRSPFFGYAFFVALFLNWKVWFYLVFSKAPVLDRFQYFDDNTSTKSLIILPLVIGFLLTVASPWVRWFFIRIAEYPTTRRALVQAKSEQDVLAGKAAMERARVDLQSTREESLISEAKRDAAISEIEDDEVRSKLQRQIDELRDSMKANDMAFTPSDQNADLRLDLIEHGKGHRFKLTNISGVTARNIDLELELAENQHDPIPDSEYLKFPVPMLSPGATMSVLARIPLGVATAYSAIVSWENPNGDHTHAKLYASL